ncbi:hypothetical protein L6164_018765 [Bauhinia variegata]|uniref:Uncharacterized protein n=1 Tax=Bauhinia variegata TaxID=167791 RepID=A0ACB9NH26_BAUVA|nr:hypothetical protein L6164_018765 [Bauhinia variegata]
MSAAARCLHPFLRYNSNKKSFFAIFRCLSFGSASNFRSIQSPIIRKSICFFATEASPDKERVTDEVLAGFLSTIENAPTASLEVYYAYIDKMCKAGSISAASHMLQILHDKNIFFTPNMYDLLLAEASQKNNINLSCQVFEKLLLSCESFSATSYHNFAKAFTKINDCAELLRFIEEVAKMTFSSTSVVNRIIFAFAKSGQADKALLIFNHFKRRSFSLDLITYNIVLDILGRAGDVDKMLHEFTSMKEAGVVPDTISYNTLINSLRKVGRLDMCLLFFKEMDENGIKPDLLTYTAIIQIFGRTGNVEESLRCFRDMKLKGIRPSIYIYRSLINTSKKLGKVELATELLEEMNSSSSTLAGPNDFKRKGRR